jgi:signal transduction histidine kinase
VQAVLSVAEEKQERRRMAIALAAAGALALAGSVLIAAFLGRRSVRGLVGALARQRRFVADASHELRTPLAVLSTRAQLAERRATDARARQDLHDLRADVARLQDVLDDLLEAAEPTQGSEPRSCDAAEVAAQVVASFAAAAAEDGVALSLDTGDPPLAVAAPARTLRRTLTALLDNALRHTPSGGTVRVTVETRTQRRRPHVVLLVADTGPGMAEPEAAFSRRHRGNDDGEAGRRRYGLGLALVADAVHRNGGTVDVESGPGGTTFVIALPTVRTAPAAP